MTENALQTDITQIGAVAVIFIFAVKEFFAYLKTRNSETNRQSESKSSDTLSDLILRELQTMNNNHLHTIQGVIEQGNERTIASFNAHAESEHSDNMQIAQLLGEIKGQLQK